VCPTPYPGSLHPIAGTRYLAHEGSLHAMPW